MALWRHLELLPGRSALAAGRLAISARRPASASNSHSPRKSSKEKRGFVFSVADKSSFGGTLSSSGSKGSGLFLEHAYWKNPSKAD